MSDAPRDGFLGRWSRRKAQARVGEPVPEPPLPAMAPEAVKNANLESDQPHVRADIAQPAIKTEASAFTLDDVQALTPDSDFRPFVARAVAPEVRNAAFKKLFSDPRFNVMDGLDAHLDDYTQPDPLPASMLRQLASARVLKLVDDAPGEASTPEEVASPANPAPAHNRPEAAPADAVAAEPAFDSHQPDALSACADGAPASDDQDPDLRLQPDDAARRHADRPGAG